MSASSRPAEEAVGAKLPLSKARLSRRLDWSVGIIGSGLSDHLRGDLGANVLMGLGSDDTLEGRGGDDSWMEAKE